MRTALAATDLYSGMSARAYTAARQQQQCVWAVVQGLSGHVIAQCPGYLELSARMCSCFITSVTRAYRIKSLGLTGLWPKLELHIYAVPGAVCTWFM